MIQRVVSTATALFFAGTMFFLPFDAGEGWQRGLSLFVFGDLVTHISYFVHDHPLPADFSSDTLSLLILLGLLAILAAALGWILSALKTGFRVAKVVRIGGSYYLAYVLLCYGVGKILGLQFYIPEANVLFTPFGQLTKDILFWSTVGTSHSFNVVTGIIECAIALLLLLGRTRVLGLFLCLFVLLGIVLLNFTFDISVKLFSLLLTALNLFCLWPVLPALGRFFAGKGVVSLNGLFPQWSIRSVWTLWQQVFLASTIVVTAIWQQLPTDRHRAFPNGAYEVVSGVASRPGSIRRFFCPQSRLPDPTGYDRVSCGLPFRGGGPCYFGRGLRRKKDGRPFSVFPKRQFVTPRGARKGLAVQREGNRYPETSRFAG
ncbi:hypothetical protein [Flavobacterium sp. N1718]|uniref:hypothetical protein n=1 Tax=Flavobacterium sp. N1718 TaxID=2986822 RepID=UPI0022247F3D|nr:hypothetical protein [Flavobacterium sp. N1718]